MRRKGQGVAKGHRVTTLQSLIASRTIKNREWEDESANHLLQFLKDTQADEWRITGRDVLVDPHTRENFDFELALGERRIALELFRLVESEAELADSRAWVRFTELLRADMEGRGLDNYSVAVPCVTKASSQAQAKRVREVVDTLEGKVKGDAGIVEIEINQITFRKTHGLDVPPFWRIGDFGMYDSAGTAHRILERILPKKNKQVSMRGHEGVLLVVHWLGLVNAQDFAEASARIDFRLFPNIERIYFEEGHDAMALAFHRAAA